MKERNEALDCLKGIAILLVMFGHVQVHNHMTDPYLYDVIKSIQMPMFFLISGYLAGTGKKITNLEQYRKKIGRRAVAYLLPFFSWLVVQHMTYVPQALRTVLFQLDYGLWFLMALFLFTVLCYTAQLLEAVTEKEIAFWAVWLTGCCVILVSCWSHIFKSCYSDHLSALLYGSIFCGKTPGICGNICTGFHAAVDRSTLRCCISGDGRDA